MDLADIIGIVGRGDVPAVFELLGEVPHLVHVIVVVAHRVKDLDVLELLVHQPQIVQEFKLVVVPVQVPGHVAEGEDVFLAGRSRERLVQVGRKGVELRHVGGRRVPVRQMHVAQHEQREVVVVHLRQGEVDTVHDLGIRTDRTVELRKDAVRRHLIAGRDGHEHIAVLLEGFQEIDAVLPGRRHFITVRDNHARDRFVSAGHQAVDIHAFGDRHIYVFDNKYLRRTDLLLFASAGDIERVFPVHDIPVHRKDQLAGGNGDDGTVETVVGNRPEDHLVILADPGVPAQVQRHIGAGFSLYSGGQGDLGDNDAGSIVARLRLIILFTRYNKNSRN